MHFTARRKHRVYVCPWPGTQSIQFRKQPTNPSHVSSLSLSLSLSLNDSVKWRLVVTGFILFLRDSLFTSCLSGCEFAHFPVKPRYKARSLIARTVCGGGAKTGNCNNLSAPAFETVTRVAWYSLNYSFYGSKFSEATRR